MLYIILVKYLKSLYPVMQDHPDVFEDIIKKQNKWIAENAEKMNVVQSKLKKDRETLSADLEFLSAVEHKSRIENVPTRGCGGQRYYKNIFDFLDKQFFELVPNDFFHFTMEEKELTKEKISKFLEDNNSEVGDLSIDQYLLNLNQAKEPVGRAVCHQDFFYSLHRKLAGEDANTSNLMAASLLFHLINHPEWKSCLNHPKAKPTLVDSAYLFIEYLHQEKKVDDAIIHFFNQIFLIIEVAEKYSTRNKRTSAEHMDRITSIAQEFFVRSLFSAPLLRMMTSVKPLINFAQVNRLLSIEELNADWQQVSLVGGIHTTKVMVAKSCGANSIIWLNLLKFLDDRIIFQNLINGSVFRGINLSLMLNDENISAIAKAFYDATNDSTKQMWTQITPEIQELFAAKNPKEAEIFYAKLREATPADKKQTLFLPKLISDKYNEKTAKKIKLREEEIKKNKALLSAMQAKEARRKTTASLDLPKTPFSQPKKNQVQSEPASAKEELINLNQEEQEKFLKSIRASVAEDASIKFEWIKKAENEAGYFWLNFSDVPHEFKIRRAQDQNYHAFTLTPEKRKEFLTRYLPILFRDELKSEVTVNVDEGGLRIKPKKTQCSYPVNMQAAAFDFLEKHSVKATQTKNEMPFFKAKKQSPHSSGLGQPTSSLTSGQHQDAIKALQVASAAPDQPIEIIKKIWREMVVDVLPSQEFNFITLKRKHNQFVISVNLKGAPYLSGHDKQVDTYVAVKSIAMALSGEGFSITPDELNPEKYKGKPCDIMFNVSKNKKLTDMAIKLNNSIELRELFNSYFKINKAFVDCHEAIKKINQEMQSVETQTEVVLTESEQIKEKFCRSFRLLTVPKEHMVCLDELFKTLKKLNELSATENLHPDVLKGIESAKFVCYHRIFHNLTWVFEGKNDNNNAVFTRTMRDAFRHGYLEMPPDFMEVIDELMAALMSYTKDTSMQFANPSLRHVSFNLTQTLYYKFVTKINSFIQMKSNHTIGDTTRANRRAEVSQLKAAITYLESTSFNDPLKQSMIVAMMSRIGETEKEAPYAEVYGRLGTHDHNLTILPDQLNKEIFDLINTSPRNKLNK